MAVKLDPDEFVIAEAGLSFWLFQPSLFIIATTLFAGAYLFFTGSTGLLTLALITACVLTAIRLYIIFASTSIILTNRRFVVARGFLNRDVKELYLNRIEGITIRQTLTARLMGYGTVEASGVGNEIAPIDGIAAPWAMHKAASEAINAAMSAERGALAAARTAAAAPSVGTA